MSEQKDQQSPKGGSKHGVDNEVDKDGQGADQQSMIPREMAMLLAGRAGSHNVLGQRLGFTGDKAHALQQMAPEERLKAINTELDRYSAATDRFSHTFVANWTTKP